ncbi:MAG: YggS family pyridoxal phosphate-dependent enzyme [Nocardioidaceae bacterium]
MNEQPRREEIAAGLRTVRDRIAAAAQRVGRHPRDVTLVVVTKTFPASDIRLLAGLGVRDVGENRHPEAGEKAAALGDLDLCWHFVGHVQSNKAAKVASYADVVHSVDSVRLAHRLGAGAEATGRVVTCLVQVSLDPPSTGKGRGGAARGAAQDVAAAVAATRGLQLGGVMGIAPQGEPPTGAFARLAEIAAQIRGLHPSATMVSAGMSGDLAQAVGAGATHVRVGSAVLGPRPPLR